MEKVVKEKQEKPNSDSEQRTRPNPTVQNQNNADEAINEESKEEEINMIYYLFWFSFWMLLFTLLLFWTDVVPGLGTAPSIQIFAKRCTITLQCITFVC